MSILSHPIAASAVARTLQGLTSLSQRAAGGRLASVNALVEHHVVVGADHGYDGTDDTKALASYALIARCLKQA